MRGTNRAGPNVGPIVSRRLSRALPALLAAVLGATLLAGCAAPADPGYATIHPIGSSSPYRGVAIDPPYQLPRATWTDTAGNKVSWPADGLPQLVTVLFLGYTNCPDVCPTQLADITSAIRGAPPAVRSKVGLEFITVDPRRDDAKTLRAYLDRFDPSYAGLRSDDVPMLKRAATSLGVAMTGSSDTVTGYEVGHGGQLIAFGADGTAPVIWTPGTPVADIRADLTTLVGQA